MVGSIAQIYQIEEIRDKWKSPKNGSRPFWSYSLCWDEKWPFFFCNNNIVIKAIRITFNTLIDNKDNKLLFSQILHNYSQT